MAKAKNVIVINVNCFPNINMATNVFFNYRQDYVNARLWPTNRQFMFAQRHLANRFNTCCGIMRLFRPH